MADDKNNTSTNTANAEFYSGEDNDGGERGRITVSENSGSRSSSSSWAALTRPPWAVLASQPLPSPEEHRHPPRQQQRELGL
eukprot:scaffold9279_cov132-Skeletonema_dohrnii-CCMP3373.AAC.1